VLGVELGHQSLRSLECVTRRLADGAHANQVAAALGFHDHHLRVRRHDPDGAPVERRSVGVLGLLPLVFFRQRLDLGRRRALRCRVVAGDRVLPMEGTAGVHPGHSRPRVVLGLELPPGLPKCHGRLASAEVDLPLPASPVELPHHDAPDLAGWTLGVGLERPGGMGVVDPELGRLLPPLLAAQPRDVLLGAKIVLRAVEPDLHGGRIDLGELVVVGLKTQGQVELVAVLEHQERRVSVLFLAGTHLGADPLRRRLLGLGRLLVRLPLPLPVLLFDVALRVLARVSMVHEAPTLVGSALGGCDQKAVGAGAPVVQRNEGAPVVDHVVGPHLARDVDRLLFGLGLGRHLRRLSDLCLELGLELE
jgi:hypothetical protein